MEVFQSTSLLSAGSTRLEHPRSMTIQSLFEVFQQRRTHLFICGLFHQLTVHTGIKFLQMCNLNLFPFNFNPLVLVMLPGQYSISVLPLLCDNPLDILDIYPLDDIILIPHLPSVAFSEVLIYPHYFQTPHCFDSPPLNLLPMSLPFF